MWRTSTRNECFKSQFFLHFAFPKRTYKPTAASSTGHGVQRQGATNGHRTLCQGAIMTAPNDGLDGQMVKYALFVFIETWVMSRIASCWFLPRKSNKHDSHDFEVLQFTSALVGSAIGHDVPIASSSYTHLDAQALGFFGWATRSANPRCHRFWVVITWLCFVLIPMGSLKNHSKDPGTLTKQDVHIDFMIHITLGFAICCSNCKCWWCCSL